MKVVILAGGFGTRLSEETSRIPKPMVEIGGMPILWHIMKGYAAYGFNEFIICCGYKQHVIKQFFNDYFLYSSDLTFDFTEGEPRIRVHKNTTDRWRVTVVDTGLHTMTGGRIKRIRGYLNPNEPFMLTYGDGLSDVDIHALLAFHRASGRLATLTVVNAGQRFGVVRTEPNGEEGRITSFREKRDSDGHPINGGFMVLEPRVLDYIEGDETVFETTPLESLADDGELMGFRHDGFWQCMDMQKDREALERLWLSGSAPWKNWED